MLPSHSLLASSYNGHGETTIMFGIIHLWVFPKWLSLNSVNHDQIQEQYGYQRYFISHNRYIPWYSRVVKSNFPLLSVGWYLFRVVSGNRYLPRGSNENIFCITSITSTGNVSIARWVIPLENILLLDLVMIHWIRWIQGKSFKEKLMSKISQTGASTSEFWDINPLFGKIFCRQLHESLRNWTGERVPSAPTPDPPV